MNTIKQHYIHAWKCHKESPLIDTSIYNSYMPINNLLKSILRLGVVAHTSAHEAEAGRSLCEFQASLMHVINCRPTGLASQTLSGRNKPTKHVLG